MELEDFLRQLGDRHELNDSKMEFSTKVDIVGFPYTPTTYHLAEADWRKPQTFAVWITAFELKFEQADFANSKQGFSPLYRNVRPLSPMLCGRGCNIQMKIGSSDTQRWGRADCLVTGNGP